MTLAKENETNNMNRGLMLPSKKRGSYALSRLLHIFKTIYEMLIELKNIANETQN